MTLFAREQPVGRQHLKRAGFALPTILIASIVMLTVLLVSVSSTSTVRTALKSQYYEQLAQVAGEAGIAYAEACLNANANVPQWSNGSPLKPNTDCTGTETVSCPTTSTNALCSVSKNGNVRSSFSLGSPTLDSIGRAVTLPNTGYVEVLRNSNSQVWRRYDQKVTQQAVVPDLCSGAAGSIYGWNNAVNHGGSFSAEPTARYISATSYGNVNPGPIFLRKDFSVVKPGTYILNTVSDDLGAVWLDGTAVVNLSAGVQTRNLSLTAGCHSILVKTVNTGMVQNPMNVALALEKSDESTPLIVTDTSWRVSSGNTAHYSSVDYYADPNSWFVARDVRASTGEATWTATTGDSTARFITSNASIDGSGNSPFNQWTNLRDSRTVTVASNTDVKVGVQCDDNCVVYMDGQVIIPSATWSTVYISTITLTPGTHKFGVALYNGGAAYNAAGFSLAVVRISDGVTLTGSDASWTGSSAWAASDVNPVSYSNSYFPNPNTSTSPAAQVLVVGGGGSGGGSQGTSIASGGGGGGGVVYETSYPIYPKAYTVTVGAGGVGVSGFAAGGKGGDSVFDKLTALGGGAGGTWTIPATFGGSGGGTSENNTNLLGMPGIAQQGFAGGTGSLVYDGGATSAGAGGGGATAAGANAGGNTAGGAGGAGFTSSITGTALVYGSGGGGAGSTSAGAGGSGGGAGRATTTGRGTSGTTNRGGGGGGSLTNANEATQIGSKGGSGVVIIAYLTGTITATGGSITTSGGYTIHRFTSSGTFNVTATN